MKIFKRIIAAFAFLTIFPIPGGIKLENEDIGRSRAFFPVVGIAVGGGYLLCALSAPWLSFISAVSIVVLGTVITRALHLDGLADLADGLGGGTTRRRTLEIMRDSSTGAFGAVAIVLVLMTKLTAIVSVMFFSSFKIDDVLIMILPPVIGRWTMVWLIQFFPYARSTGKGTAFEKHRDPADMVIAGIVTAAVCFLAGGFAGLVILAAVTVLVHSACIFISKRLKGLTGDVYGAMFEISEAAVFVAIMVLFVNFR